MTSPFEDMRIAQLRLLDAGPVTHQWQPADGFHVLIVGEQTFKGRDLHELINHAAEWVKTAKTMEQP